MLRQFYSLVWGGERLTSGSRLHLFRTISLLHRLQALRGVDVGPNYFTFILQSSVGRGEAHFWV